MTPTLTKSFHLRGESCALRGAFLRWILFAVALAVAAPFFIVAVEMWGNPRDSLSFAISMILIGPEAVVVAILDRYVPVFRDWPDDLQMMLVLAIFVARSCAVFGYGVFRLSRGKRTFYAETLCFLGICAFVAVWINPTYLAQTDNRILFYVFGALLVMVGFVIFVLQHRRSPA